MKRQAVRRLVMATAGMGMAWAVPGWAGVTSSGDTLSQPNSYSSNPTLYAGYNGTGSLSIDAGSTLSNYDAYLGYNAAAAGTVTVNGAGSTWAASLEYVGYLGQGTLTLQDGGKNTAQTLYIGNYSGSNGAVDVSGADSRLNISFNVYVGKSGIGALTLENGAQAANGVSYIGFDPGSTGSAIVRGPGSSWTTNQTLYVGYGGGGSLTVDDGATVSATTFFASLGDLQGNGTINVQGGAVLDADMVFDASHPLTKTLSFGSGGTLNLTLNGSSDFGVGHKHTGSLRIADGKVINSTFGYLGDAAGSVATATISGAGSKWANSNYMYVGLGGNATMTIEDSAQVTATAALIAVRAGTTGLATVSGTGSTLAIGGRPADGNNGLLEIGQSGSGTLAVAKGGQVSSINTYIGWSDYNYGYGTPGTGRVTVSGAGSLWTNSGKLYVGDLGTGTLAIEDGGQVNTATTSIAYDKGSSGTVTVQGTNAKWTNSGALTIGEGGQGALTVLNGGQVSSGSITVGKVSSGTLNIGSGGQVTSGAFSIGYSDMYGGSGSGMLNISDGGQLASTSGAIAGTGSTGTALVSGAGSTWTVSGNLGFGSGALLTVEKGGRVSSNSLYLNSGNENALNVTNGGQVISASGTISSGSATVDGSGSTWTTSGTLSLGSSSKGVLTVRNGGQVSSATGYVGQNTAGEATVTGSSSKWTTSGSFYVGYWGAGTLTISDGGQVSNAAAYLGSQAAPGTSAVVVRGLGSQWTSSGSLTIGNPYWIPSTLTVAEGAQVTARDLTMTGGSTVRLGVTGNDALVLGNATSPGSLTNNGEIRLYAASSLHAGTYTPISACPGQSLTWSGAGFYTAIGGTWDSTAHTFTVSPASAVSSGNARAINTGDRLIITDPGSGKQVGASFGSVAAGTTFAATLMGSNEVDPLLPMLDSQDSVLMAWDFTTNIANSEMLLSCDAGPGATNLRFWHYKDGAWSAYAPGLTSYDLDGTVSFTVNSFSGYAVTAAVPEPVVISGLSVSCLALLRRQRRK